MALAAAALTVGSVARADQPIAPAGGCCAQGGCGSCDPSGGSHLGPKTKRFFSWLIYVPLDLGKTKCCQGCSGCTPPAWVFFPCQGSGRKCAPCAGIVAPETMYFAKAAGAPTAGQVVQAGYPTTAESTAGGERRLSTYKPGTVAATMPVLGPEQFRKPPAAGSCAASKK
jgi:hypothetical protein